MRRIPVVIIFGLLLSSLPNATLASVAWLSDVRQAQQIAQEQQRLVLLHFYADWCGPCIHLEREVYPRVEISSAISANFVPVKIDVQRAPDLVRHYGIQSFPTDVFLEPSGRILLRTTSPPDAGRYLQMLNQLAQSRSQPPQQNPPPANPAILAQAWNSNPGHQVPLTDPPTPPPAAPPAPEPKLALEGYCPVSLIQRENWVRGDQQWGAIHRGRVYLFVSLAHWQQFMDDPDQYSPVLSGYDPTRLIDQAEVVEGRRQHGMWFRGRMYLFAEEASLERFQRSPEHYAQRSHEIMMRGTLR